MIAMACLDFRNKYKPPCFYHFTDLRNISSIAKHGLLSLKEMKCRGVSVPHPGGNDWSHEEDARLGLDEYVHLCPRHRHPMEYVARKEGRIGTTLFIAVSVDVLDVDGVRFTSGVANKAGVCLLEPEKAQSDLDFEVLYSKLDWGDPQVMSRLKIAEKYEILVPKAIPLKYIRLPNYGT